MNMRQRWLKRVEDAKKAKAEAELKSQELQKEEVKETLAPDPVGEVGQEGKKGLIEKLKDTFGV